MTSVYSTAQSSPSSLLPRPALYLFSYVVSALYLLEHATWAYTTGEHSVEIDVEVFHRWVDESGLQGALQDVQRVKASGAERIGLDAEIVYGKAADGISSMEDRASARL